MKLDSKSGATLAAAAATLFLAGAVVTDHIEPSECRAGQVHGRQRLQGPERLQGRREFLQGPERLQGHRLLDELARQVRCHGRRFRQELIVPNDARGLGIMPGPHRSGHLFGHHENKFRWPCNQIDREA